MSNPLNNSKKMSNKEVLLATVSGGVCIALSFVLSQLKLFEMPMGGSVTPASSLPIAIYAAAYGPVWGGIAALVYSIIQLIQGLGYFVTPFQMFLDYIMGYLALGIIGFAAPSFNVRRNISNPLKRFAKAGLMKAMVFTVIAYIVRWFCSVLSGVIFYAEYAPEGMNPWVYSMAYNGSFLAADLVIVLAVMAAFYGVVKTGTKTSSAPASQSAQ